MATLTIKSNLRYCELRQYKKMFESMGFDEISFTLYLNKKPFEAKLKYGRVEQRLKYDRKNKYKIYLDGVVNKKEQKELIKNLYELRPSKPILLGEILFAKEKQEIKENDDGELEYHFTFLQY